MLEPCFQNHYSSNKFCCENKHLASFTLWADPCFYKKHAGMNSKTKDCMYNSETLLPQNNAVKRLVGHAESRSSQGFCSGPSLSLSFPPNSTTLVLCHHVSYWMQPGLIFPGWSSPRHWRHTSRKRKASIACTAQWWRNKVRLNSVQ